MAASSLASQLKTLARAPAPSVGRAHQRPSLVFDPKQAADIDVESIFALALAGLEKLASMENGATLAAYKSTLFSEQSVHTDRELQSKQLNDELNRSISSFLRRLSGLILVPECHHVLEYLIRRYKIHIYNVDDVMVAILPYHETSVFVRIVQILQQLEKTRWLAFAGVKESGAAPPREVLVQRCLNDMGFLEAICESGLNPAFQSKVHATFTSVLLMEVLSSVQAVTTILVMKILPFILDALKENVLSEFQVGGIVVVGVLVNRATLSEKTTFAIAVALCTMLAKLDDASTIAAGILLLIEIAQKQELARFPLKVWRPLMKVRNVFTLIADFSKTYNADKLITLLLTYLCDRMLEKELVEAAQTLPLGKHVHSLVCNLLHKAELTERTKKFINKVLVELDKRFPDELDKSINNIFQAEVKNKDEWLKFLGEVFQSSLRRPVLGQSTLYSSFDHPDVTIRKTAVMNVPELFKTGLEPKAEQFVKDALFRLLEDDDFTIVHSVLSVEDIAKLLPGQELAEALIRLLNKWMDLAGTGPKALRKAAKQAVELSIKVLTSKLANLQAITSFEKSMIQGGLLSHVLLHPKTWELNLAFVDASRDFPVTPLPPREVVTKAEAVEWRSKYNHKIVEALASGPSLQLLHGAVSLNQSAKPLLALVILASIQQQASPSFEECFSFLSDEWNAAGKDSDLSHLEGCEPFDDSDYLDLYKRLQESPSEAYVELLFRCLFKVAQMLVHSSIDQLQKMQCIDRLFLLFAGSSTWKHFQPHIRCVLEFLSTNAAVFLSKFFTSEEPLPERVQRHTLEIIRACYEGSMDLPEQIQTSIPCVLSALANPRKSVRKRAISCMKAMLKHAQASLASQGMDTLFELVIEEKDALIGNDRFFRSFFVSSLAENDTNNRISTDACKSIVEFLLQNVEKLPPPVQTVIFEALHDVGFAAVKGRVTKPVLIQLLQRRRLHHFGQTGSSENGLKPLELYLIDMLLEINVESMIQLLKSGEGLEAGQGESYALWPLLQVLDVYGGSPKDAAVIRPCLTGLKLVSPELYSSLDSRAQDSMFRALIHLSGVPDETVSPAAQQALDMIMVSVATISNYVQSLVTKKGSKRARLSYGGEDKNVVVASTSFLEFLMRRTSKQASAELLDPLFRLLRAHFHGVWPHREDILEKDVQFMGQLLLASLENAINSVGLLKDPSVLDVDILVQYVIKSRDVENALSVLTAIAKSHPDRVRKNVIDIVSAVGASTITQDNNHSHKVVQDFLEAVVPSWLEALSDPKPLLQIFIKALPAIPVHRCNDLMKCVMRVTKEETSIPTFLHLQAGDEGSDLSFADIFLRSYPWNTKADALSKLATMLETNKSGADLEAKSEDFWSTLERGTAFLARHSQELFTKPLDDETAMSSARLLLGFAIRQADVLSSKRVNSLKAKTCLESAQALLDSLAKSLTPRLLCKSVTSILSDSKDAISRKVLEIYMLKLKASDPSVVSKRKVDADKDPKPHLEVAIQLLELLKGSGKGSSSRTKKVAVSAMEVLAQRFAAASSTTFASFLPCLIDNFQSSDKALVASCLRCVTSIVISVGTEALPSLPALMTGLKKIAEEADQDDVDLQLAVLRAFEGIVDKLAGFISPHIEAMVGLVILRPQYTTSSPNVAEKASVLRALIAEKIPPRLLLDPLSNVYKKAIGKGDASTIAVFQTIGVMASKLDRAAVEAYHSRIFGICMEALDLRRKHPESFAKIHLVEDSVISAILSLVMKLNESTFKPLFIAVHSWAESTTFEGNDAGTASIDRSIPFYKLVIQLVEKLRSVFVPYFAYLLNACVVWLGETTEERPKKKRKAKSGPTSALALAKWHLQRLIVSALHKCFLYDTVDFVDGPKFQQLLVPLAGQLVADVPSEVEQSDMPSPKEADQELVSCLVRLGLAADSDIYWKSLNHEVLMHTRRQGQRPKLLALEVVKSLAENVKEEFIVLIAETVPFLSELLEDEDLTVQAKSQEVVKVLEEISGESLGQYL